MRLDKLAVTALFATMLALPALAQTPTAPAKPATTHPMPAATAPVNLNTASPEQLDALPGIGPSRLRKIIAARPFKSVDELDSKKVIPHSVYLKIKDKVAI